MTKYRTLSEIIEDLQNLNDNKRQMPIGSMRDRLEEISKELRDISVLLIL